MSGPSSVAAFAATLSYSELTHGAVHGAKASLLNVLALQMAGWLGEASKIARDYGYLNEAHTGSTIVGTHTRAAPEVAAYVNTIHLSSDSAPSAAMSAVPALLALGELAGKGGHDLILGIVVAYDVAACTDEAFAAGVAGAGAMMGMDEETIELALGYGSAPSPGGFERAISARDIVTASCLAQMGMGGAAPGFEIAQGLSIPRVKYSIEEASDNGAVEDFVESAELLLRPVQIESVLHIVETLDEVETLVDLFDCLVV